jgi:hypothetical protein
MLMSFSKVLMSGNVERGQGYEVGRHLIWNCLIAIFLKRCRNAAMASSFSSGG